MSAKFYAESFAPWCERARWALDHHRVAYREIEQRPLLSELTLRIAAQQLMARVTVPLLVADGLQLMGSDDIARHAERVGSGAPLFRPGPVAPWLVASEQLMVAGRALLLPRMAAHPAALREQFWLRGVAALGVRHLMRKYAVRAADRELHETEARKVLDRVRAALSGRAFLVGDAFSYADITIACALQFVLPVGGPYIALGAATREVWTHTELAAEYADLLAWRDRLYREHR